MLVYVGDLAYKHREHHAPRRRIELLVHAALSQCRAHMDHRDTERARLRGKGIERLNDLAATQARAGAVGVFGEVPVVHIDGDDGCVVTVKKYFCEIFGNFLGNIVKIRFHSHYSSLFFWGMVFLPRVCIVAQTGRMRFMRRAQ